MRDRRRHLVGFSVAALLALAAAPAAAGASPGLAAAVPSLGGGAQKPFAAPRPRPTEGLARPTDKPDPSRLTYTVPEARRSPACSQFFCVHWVSRGLDAPSRADRDHDRIPDYVETVLEVAEHVHYVENEQLGWREPKGDGTLGGGLDKTDIYLLQATSQLFGYAAPDPRQISKQRPVPRQLYAYLVLDNDYSAFDFPGTDPLADLEVTLAHEYNHVLQFGYDAFQDPWFAEATAVWMEDQVYDEINDYYRYIPHWVRDPLTPLTANAFKYYGSAVWNQWLATRYGEAIVREAWADTLAARPPGFALGVYDRAIRDAGSSFSRDFTRFAAAVAEWRTGEGFRESGRFPDMPRQGELKLGAAAEVRQLDHTTFVPLQVLARGGRAVVVRVSAPAGIATGLALVGRVGTEREGSTVSDLDFARHGGELAVRLEDPGQFSRITAVLVNADGRADGFSARRVDWRYAADRVPFAIRGELVR